MNFAEHFHFIRLKNEGPKKFWIFLFIYIMIVNFTQELLGWEKWQFFESKKINKSVILFLVNTINIRTRIVGGQWCHKKKPYMEMDCQFIPYIANSWRHKPPVFHVQISLNSTILLPVENFPDMIFLSKLFKIIALYTSLTNSRRTVTL